MTLHRTIRNYLTNWKDSKFRKVLLVRGARQVGKTYEIRLLGKTFKRFIELNLEEQPKIKELFENDSLNINQIIENISAFFDTTIVDSETLIFIDEIQASPKAISKLRFFYEKRPNLHVVATGSLLDFALEEIESFGVGRIEYLYMYPVSFYEYLVSIDQELLLKNIKQSSYLEPLSDLLHSKALNSLKSYLILGGMPEVLAYYQKTKDIINSAKNISDIITGYEDDFAKYKTKIKSQNLLDTFRATSIQAGKKFVYSHAYRDANSKIVHESLDLLVKAGIVHKIFHSSSNGIPLGGEIDINKFKTIPHDIGIYNRMSGITLSEFALLNPLDLINKGSLAEVYCGLELLWNSEPYIKDNLYYWHREQKSSNAEVDYVISLNGKIYPIEVKASGKGAMHSMRRFLTEKKSEIGIRVSTENFGRYQDVLTVPLYAIGEIQRILKNL